MSEEMVKVQNVCKLGFLASASVVCFIVVVFSGSASVNASVEDVLAGLSTPDLNNLLLNLEDYSPPEYEFNQAPEYDDDYATTNDAAPGGDDYFLEGPEEPQPIGNQKSVEQRADVTRADVPKHAGVTSQQKAAATSAHSAATAAVSAVLPAYCDPPNPCPLGYTAEDGCIEGFENTSEFSRRYQSTQNCICDTEHMFNCQSQTTGDASDAQGDAPSFKGTLADDDDEGFLAEMNNPYLTGEKLRVAAKKGLGF